MNIKNYLDDGANWQAQAVLAYLKSCEDHNIHVTRYDNCREQGYIFYKRVLNLAENKMCQMNIAVYEHRNSDALCIVAFEKLTHESPLNSDVWENMEDKWDTTADFDCGKIVDCGDTILEMFEEFEEGVL